MTYIPDMTPCSYFPIEGEHDLVAVGWLEGDQEFTTGSVAEPVYRKLQKLLDNPWQPLLFPGLHECTLCQFDGASGSANLFVPYQGQLFVAPELILHYIACHHYQPPSQFTEAVMECPIPSTMEYKRKLLANGGRHLIKSIR